jgi:hypothetical protein
VTASLAPFVVIGVAAVFLGITKKQAGGYRYSRPGASSRTTVGG